MEIRFANTSKADVEMLYNKLTKNNKRLWIKKIADKYDDGDVAITFATILMGVAGVVGLFNLDKLDSMGCWYGINLILLFSALALMYVCGIVVFYTIINGVIMNTNAYREFKIWLRFVDTVTALREACETQEFLQQHELKAVRVGKGECELEVYCASGAENVTVTHKEYKLPNYTRSVLVATGVLDFTCIDDVMNGLKGICNELSK